MCWDSHHRIITIIIPRAYCVFAVVVHSYDGFFSENLSSPFFQAFFNLQVRNYLCCSLVLSTYHKDRILFSLLLADVASGAADA